MGGESSVLEDNCDTQLHSAFKKLKVNSEWTPSKISKFSEDLQTLWPRNSSAVPSQPESCCVSQKCGKSSKAKVGGHTSRMEPYPQDFLCSMAEKLTFNSEVCRNRSCTCSDVSKRSGKHSKYAMSTGRPLIQGAKLKLHHSEKDKKQIIRAARLKIFKQNSLSEKRTGVKQLFGSQTAMKSHMAHSAQDFPLFGANKEKYQSFKSVATQNHSHESSTKLIKPNALQHNSFRSHSRIKHSRERLSSDIDEGKRNSYSDCGKEMRQSEQGKLEDITVDELAGYFDDFVYIPKKMSSMAEMMYT